MKVAVYHPFEVTEEQRLQLGALLSGKTKPKRAATREEVKTYFLEHGSKWDTVLAEQYAEQFPNGAEDDEAEEDDEDLV